jgi:hypothetical protein
MQSLWQCREQPVQGTQSVLTFDYLWGKWDLSSTFKAYWLRDAPTGLAFNTCTLCPRCIYVFFIHLTTNSDLCHLNIN